MTFPLIGLVLSVAMIQGVLLAPPRKYQPSAFNVPVVTPVKSSLVRTMEAFPDVGNAVRQASVSPMRRGKLQAVFMVLEGVGFML